MSVRLTVSTRNLAGLVANLLSADEIAQRTIRRTVKVYGRKQQRLSESLAPYDHSHDPEDFHLRDNIRLRFSDDGLVYEVGALEKDYRDAGLPFYAIYQEFGTRFMAPQPFIFPARDEIYPQFKAALGANIRGALRRRKAA